MRLITEDYKHCVSVLKVNSLKLLSSSSFHQGLSAGSTDVNQYKMENLVEGLTYLYRVVANSYQLDSCNEGIRNFLQAGVRRFDADVAIVTRPVSQQRYEVLACVGDDEKFYVGQHLSLAGTLCERVINENETCVYSNLHNQGVHSLTMAYNNTPVGAYLGTVVKPANTEPAVVCFIRAQGLEERRVGLGEYDRAVYSDEDVAFLELLAEGVAFMTDQQLAQAQRKLTDQAMFALGSVKTLDEYLEQARLPEVFGVPARVVEVLERRIGRAPLSIGHIAEELNLSKRTLQRRLQQQDVSFADLRDQVRFHYSIDYLIKQHLSIDSISASLDFSDRTSFTNAFKRWTGLSPSTFRKLFRDYV
ncbi:AraC-type DNA-binding protein [Alteromonadaceae bacterium Bs31]|nr:AraC-type DNA-binding protein [Alteromonadaceae bacterium Bs31]